MDKSGKRGVGSTLEGKGYTHDNIVRSIRHTSSGVGAHNGETHGPNPNGAAT